MANKREILFTITTGLDSSVERNFDFMEARSKRVASQIEQNLNGSFSNVEARAQKAMTGAGNPFQNVGPQARMSVAEARAAFGAGFDEMVKTGRVGANEIGKSLAGGVAGGVAKGTRDAQQLLGAHLKAMKIAMREAERDIGSGSLNPFARAALSRVVPGGFLTTSVVNELSKFNSEAARTQAMLKAVDPEFAIFLRQFKSLPTEAERAAFAAEKFGGDVEKLLPAINSAATDLTNLETASAGAGSGLAALAGPVGVIVVAAVAVVGALTLGLYNLATSTAETAGKYDILSKEVNFTAHTLSALDVAAAQNNVSFQQVSASLGIFDKKLEAGAEKSSKLSRVLQAYGVDVRDNQKALEGLFSILVKLPEGETQTALAMEAFGRGGKSMLAIVKQAHGDLPTLIKLLDDMGATISDKDAAAAKDFDAKLEVLKRQFDAAKVKVGEELLPVFGKLFDDLSVWLSKNQGELRAWGEMFAGIAQGIIDSIAGIHAAMNTATTFAGGSAKDDLHSGGASQSMWNRYWSGDTDWQRQIAGRPDLIPGGTVPWETGAVAGQSEWERGTGKGTTHMMTPAEVTEQARQSQVDAATQKRADDAYAAYLRRVERDKQAAAAHVSHLMGESPKKHRGDEAAKAAERASREALQSAQIDLRDAESVYKEGNDIAKRALDLNLNDYAEYNKRRAELETERYEKEKAVFTVERGDVGGLKPGERAVKLKDITQREQAALREYNEKQAQITTDGLLHDRDVKRKHAEESVRIMEATNANEIGARKAEAEIGLRTEQDVEDRRYQLQQQVFAEKQKQINEDLALYKGVDDEKLKITQQAGELLKAEEQAALLEHNKMTHDLRQKDIDDAANYESQLRKLQEESAQASLDLGSRRLDLMERLGTDPHELRKARAGQDIQFENALNARTVAEINANKASLAASNKKAEEKAAIEAALNQKLEVEAQRHSLTLTEIYARPLERFHERVEKLAGQISDVFGGAFDAIGKQGESFWKSLETGFAQMFRQIVRDFFTSKIKDVLESLFNPQSRNAQSQAASGAQGGGILSTVKGLFGGGGAVSGTPPFVAPSGGGGGASGIGSYSGIIKNFKQHGFIGGLKSLIGLGSAGAGAATAATASVIPSIATAGGGAAAIGALGIHEAGHAAAAGAAGGGSMFSSLGALFSNPWTIGIAAAAIGGLLLWKHFSHATEKHLRSAIKSAYQVDVKEMATLQQIKQIGESVYGKGNVGKHILETIKLDPAKQLIKQYAVSTNQTGSSLVTNMQLANASDPRNQFTRREYGGRVRPGLDYIVGERRPEVFSPDVPGHVYPSVNHYEAARERVAARLRAQAGASAREAATAAAPAGKSSQGQGSGMPASLAAAIQGTLARVADALEPFETAKAGDVVQRGLKEKPRAAADAVNSALGRGYRKPQIQRNLNLG